jgi:mRNA interferase RelE/StbE
VCAKQKKKKKKQSAYRIEIYPRAKRDLKRLKKTDNYTFRRVNAAIESLRPNPRPHGTEPLGGPAFRIRDGDYRILYEVNDTKRVVAIMSVGDRKEVYKH